MTPPEPRNFRQSRVEGLAAFNDARFSSTHVPICRWLPATNKRGGTKSRYRPARPDRRRETLSNDAVHFRAQIIWGRRELTGDDLATMVSTYQAWRGDKGAGAYAGFDGFGKSATKAEIAAHGHVLNPGRYVGAEEIEDDGEPFEKKMPYLVAKPHAQFAESAKLEQAIKANMRGPGYGN
jgi:type I restriction enzyme M protein